MEILRQKECDLDSSLFSHRSVPQLREEDEDSCDEIVLFDNDEGEISDLEEFGDYCYRGNDLLLDDVQKDGRRMVSVVHSRKDPATGDFFQERKSVQECVKCGLEEVEPGVFSSLWYFAYLFGEKEGKRAWADAANSRRIRERGGKAIRINDDVFASVQSEREKGNRNFQRGQYNSALRSYLSAEKLIGVPGMYLIPEQRDELVKILSNQAECYLRMMKYAAARDAANAALVLDKNHMKSLLRRGKAVYYGAKKLKIFNSEVAAAVEDLRLVVEANEGGTQEAQEFIDLINENLRTVAPQFH
eukprot:scaffold5517_cov135-Cylindrotheca_fusiformis.AAC.6